MPPTRRAGSPPSARPAADGWATPLRLKPSTARGEPDEIHTVRVTAPALFVARMPMARDWLRRGGGGRVEIEHRAAPSRNDALLPEPLGRIVEEFRIERASARAYQVRAGQFVQVIDVRGRQCSDFMAMRADALDAGLERHIDGTVTRTMTRGAYPRPGLHDKFFDQDMVPLLALRQDTVGRHDTFALACTARGYEERGFPGHVNCSDNISDAYAPFAIARRKAWPAVNFFFNSWIDGGPAGGSQAMGADEAWSRPGDYVAMEALTDLVCVSTACPDDVDAINGWDPTDIHVRIYERDAPIVRAVIHRWRPDEPGTMTRHSPFHPRTSELTLLLSRRPGPVASRPLRRDRRDRGILGLPRDGDGPGPVVPAQVRPVRAGRRSAAAGGHDARRLAPRGSPGALCIDVRPVRPGDRRRHAVPSGAAGVPLVLRVGGVRRMAARTGRETGPSRPRALAPRAAVQSRASGAALARRLEGTGLHPADAALAGESQMVRLHAGAASRPRGRPLHAHPHRLHGRTGLRDLLRCRRRERHLGTR